MNESLGKIREGSLTEQKRSIRVQELEEKIKKLENENEKLLNKVHTSDSAPGGTGNKRSLNSKLHNGSYNAISVDEDELENGLLDIRVLLNENKGFKEDEWLYVSPKIPPSPVQKKITPHQWLSEGHNQEGKANSDIPSLDDVRKSLIYNIDEAESLSDMSNYNAMSRQAIKGQAVSKPRQEQSAVETTPAPKEVIPVVKWKAKVPVESSPSLSEQSEEDHQASPRKWKVKQIPSTSSGMSGGSGRSNDDLLFENSWSDDEESPEGFSGQHRSVKQHQDSREEDMERLPVVKRKANLPDDDSPSGVPAVKWKAAKVPQETSSSDVPVVKWRAKMPEDSQKSDVHLQSDDVPVVKWKRPKMPEESQKSDVPVVRKKVRMPEDHDVHPQSDDVPVVKWKKPKMPEDSQNSDVPVVKWKAKDHPPQSDDVPVVKWKKAKMPEDSENSDVPVVRKQVKVPEDTQNSDGKWKAKMPEDHQSSDVPVVKWKKPKMPEEPQNPDVPVVRKQARMPEDSDVSAVKWKAKMPGDQSPDIPIVKRKAHTTSSGLDNLKPKGQLSQISPKGVRSPRKVVRVPAGDHSSSNGQSASAASVNKESPKNLQASHSHHQTQSQSSPTSYTPPGSPPGSPPHQQEQGEKITKPLSRRSSFSDSRSPSPPSIAPHVRMAIASPVLSRRTPSPSRTLSGSLGSLNARQQSSAASPGLQPRHLQYMSQQSPGTSRSFTGISPSSSGTGHVSRLRGPPSPSPNVKTSSPLKAPGSGERKKRTLPSTPSPKGTRKAKEQPNRRKLAPVKGIAQKSAQPSQSTGLGGDDDDSWLEGCF